MNAIEWDFKDRSVGHTESYLGWVKSMVRRGYVPTITVFMNQYLFYGTIDPNAGYPDYDHIGMNTRDFFLFFRFFYFLN